MSSAELRGWDRLRHGGLLLDPKRLQTVAAIEPAPLAPYHVDVLRRMLTGLGDRTGTDTTPFITFVLEVVCGLGPGTGTWVRGAQVAAEWSRKAVTGESVRPRQLWQGENGAVLPVFVDSERRLGVGRGRQALSQVLQWLRAGSERLALVTNGQQWRLIFAGLDFDAWCEWDSDLWLEEGAIGAQVDALRTLLAPPQLTPPTEHVTAPLIQAILDSRKGQAELSAALGERVREAVELLVQAHGEVLAERCGDVGPADIYRAAVRVIMRMVVVLFAESRDLLPRDNALYQGTYGLGGLLSDLERTAARGGNRLRRQYAAWPRILALFRLVSEGSHHPALPVPAYGGELFAQASAESEHGMERAVAAFEQACYERELLADAGVLQVLERLTRTRVKIRQGRASTWVSAPVDFSDLSSEYIGILYEGLLDFELRIAPAGDPVIFLAVGNQPALPLSRLEAMDDAELANLLDKMKDTSSSADEETEGAVDEDVPEEEEAQADAEPDDAEDEGEPEPDAEPDDSRLTTRTRAEVWARRAVAAGKLVPKLRGTTTPERRQEQEEKIARKARQLVTRVVLPGERYLVRWGGTRKGSGTFYTRPGLAVPLVQRTLRPMAWVPPTGGDGVPKHDAPPAEWTPRQPEEILALKVCDPACGSGTFPVGALRFLTEALYASLNHHGRISDRGDQTLIGMLGSSAGATGPGERLSEERLPCRPDDPSFEARLKAILRRHVVERCIYGVDLDPLAVELCRLALWIETMDRTLPFSFVDHKIKCGNGLIGAWFDRFQHYPVMAWKNREGGDTNHRNGVHFQQDVRGKAIKAWVKDVLAPDLRRYLAGRTLFDADLVVEATGVHDSSLDVLRRLHALPVQDTGERARRYREDFILAPAWQRLVRAMDLWCACWFWPAGELATAPLPTSFSTPDEATIAVASRVAREKRFFHWELEFPDVFQSNASGFDAILGNPPWNIAKPSSKEFFSDIDPLYRAYGKQEALEHQLEYFADEAVERRWLDYSADFRAQSNFVGYSADPFGDPEVAPTSGDRFSISRKRGENASLHERWRAARGRSVSFADSKHPYRHQGAADVNLYKLFLEQAHTLLRQGSRMGFIVPSGLYSDYGTGELRRLFLDYCQWEWLFGFENREKIFDIDSRFKFNPVILVKGGRTEAIRTAFMRRTFTDWENAEQLATSYSREQVDRFSPKSRAILEVESARDLAILEKIYANSVLLGDEGPNGWGVKYATEFHMTNDSKLFPPRPKWEAQGYRPDEYSRWLKGRWRPIAELGPELGVDPIQVAPVEVELEDWLFDTSAGPEERIAGAQFVHGQLLKPGDVQRTEWRVRCAQPPYDSLPIPRADIPAGIILSREADEWIREEEIEDVALPLYEGRMIGQFDFSQKGWVSGKGRGAVWRDIPWSRKQIEPQYLMQGAVYEDAALKRHLADIAHSEGQQAAKEEAVRLKHHESRASWWNQQVGRLAFMDVTSATNERTCIATPIPHLPSGNKTPVLRPTGGSASLLSAVLDSFSFDFVLRRRLGGLSANYFILAEAPLPQRDVVLRSGIDRACQLLTSLSGVHADSFAGASESVFDHRELVCEALLPAERLRLRCILDVVIAEAYGLTSADLAFLLSDCENPAHGSVVSMKGFWRVDSDRTPELRHTVLTHTAYRQFSEILQSLKGDTSEALRVFLTQHNHSGWLLPEHLSSARSGMEAHTTHPVASRLGPRFYDWQLARTAGEFWKERDLHSRNLLGEAGYSALHFQIESSQDDSTPIGLIPPGRPRNVAEPRVQPNLFD